MFAKKEKIGTCSASLDTEFEQEVNNVLAEGAELLDVKIIEDKNSPTGRRYCAIYKIDVTFGEKEDLHYDPITAPGPVVRTDTPEGQKFFEDVGVKRFEVVTDKDTVWCNDIEAVIDEINKVTEDQGSYIIRYYIEDQLQGGFTLEQLQRKLNKKVDRLQPILLVPVLNTVRSDLCRELSDMCRKYPAIEFAKVPGASEKADEIDIYDAFVLKYFHHKWNKNKYTYEQVDNE